MVINKDNILDFFKNCNYSVRTYYKNDIIALEGSSCEKIGLILDGEIDIKRILSSNNVIHLSSFSRGDFFGEIIAFSDTNKYPATVISSSSSNVMFISKNDFIAFCTGNPDFLNIFLNDLTNKIINLNQSITGLSLTSIRQKITNYLITQYDIQSTIFIRLNMTKQKLSEKLGVPRPSLSRELIKMKEDGLIDYNQDTIKILDLEKLKLILMQ
ncbi:MAG: Crp/Fnr family transcriptional regulator [Romboutsia sp.]|uniref:Crp/Fnr family transcriptional regulator n=1 Tax=Romboutsia sp. TaxID=1965302 RepID=UPI003F2D3F8D